MKKVLAKAFQWLKKRQDTRKNMWEALGILSKGGNPIIRIGNKFAVEKHLEGSFLAVASMLSKEFFELELNQIITSVNQIFIKRTEKFIGYLVLKGTNKVGIEIASAELSRLLNRIEFAFSKEDIKFIQPSELMPIVTQYANFIAEAC
ncbi:MAG: hypothetical protein ACFFDN_32840 [Candidatus Hodarchaeota archaeon]